jgi:integrase/recombinase XerD
MEQRIVDFTDYLRNEKKSSENTVLSYARDLKGFSRFMMESGVLDPAKVNRTNVMAYVYELQKQNKAGATVSRNIASIRSFFQFLQKKGVVADNPAADLELPKWKRKCLRSFLWKK